MQGSRLLATVSCVAIVLYSNAVAAQKSTETYSYDALGRVVAASTAGGQNSVETHSLCYDAAGSQTAYATASNGTAAGCVIGGSGGGGTPSPLTPPPPGNSPPVTQNDSISGPCYLVLPINLTANDSDPEGNTPLYLQSLTAGTGYGEAAIVSASSVRTIFGPRGDTSQVTYTVADSLSAASTGILDTAASSCSGGGSDL